MTHTPDVEKALRVMLSKSVLDRGVVFEPCPAKTAMDRLGYLRMVGYRGSFKLFVLSNVGMAEARLLPPLSAKP